MVGIDEKSTQLDVKALAFYESNFETQAYPREKGIPGPWEVEPVFLGICH
jgi:hypothetical protein